MVVVVVKSLDHYVGSQDDPRKPIKQIVALCSIDCQKVDDCNKQ